MPIALELRHHYRGPAWHATRERILDRAQHCCERCGVPNHVHVTDASDGGLMSAKIAGLRQASNWWIHDRQQSVASLPATLAKTDSERAGDTYGSF